jgi:hypothetical protein
MIFLLIGSPAFAGNCGCDSIPNWEAAYQKANVIFLGTCIDITPNTHKGGLNIVIQVDSSWKRTIEPVTTVHTKSTNQCGFPFTKGKRYLVFANKRHQTTETSECEPNEVIDDRPSATLRNLGPGFGPGRTEGMAVKLDWMLAGLVAAGLLFLMFVVLRKRLKPAKKASSS